MREKITYTLDNANRLIMKQGKRKILPDGRFKIDDANRLYFWLNAPLNWRKEFRLPERIDFKGRWQFNSNHDLEIISDKYLDGRLVLKINIISLKDDALIFGVNQIDSQGQSHLRILKLSGFWKSDEYNRINFVVEKKVSPDTLIFKGDWQTGGNQKIVYKYEKAGLKTKTRIRQALSFEGFWQIGAANKLTYILGHSEKSRFDFRAQLQSPSIYPKEGVIKYRLGAGLRQGRRPYKIVCLYGEWKFSRKLGLAFKMDYGGGRIININLAAEVHLNKENEVIFNLIDEIHKPLGIKVIFTHRFLKQHDAELFLRLKKLRQDSGIEAGVRIPF